MEGKKPKKSEQLLTIGKAILTATSQLAEIKGAPLAARLEVWDNVNRYKFKKHLEDELNELCKIANQKNSKQDRLDVFTRTAENYIQHYKTELIYYIINCRYKLLDTLGKYKVKRDEYIFNTITEAQDRLDEEINAAGGPIPFLINTMGELNRPAKTPEIEFILQVIDKICDIQKAPNFEDIDEKIIEHLSAEISSRLDISNKIEEVLSLIQRLCDRHLATIDDQSSRLIMRGNSIEQCAERAIDVLYHWKPTTTRYSQGIINNFRYSVNDGVPGDFTDKQVTTAKGRIKVKSIELGALNFLEED